MMILLNQGWRNMASTDIRRDGSIWRILLIKFFASSDLGKMDGLSQSTWLRLYRNGTNHH